MILIDCWNCDSEFERRTIVLAFGSRSPTLVAGPLTPFRLGPAGAARPSDSMALGRRMLAYMFGVESPYGACFGDLLLASSFDLALRIVFIFWTVFCSSRFCFLYVDKYE